MNHPGWTVSTGCVGALLVSGCATPGAWLEVAPKGPEWNGRRLFVTPFAYVLASDAEGAEEADRLTRAAAEQFTVDTHGVPPHGLVVVTDSQASLVVDDARLLFESGWRRIFELAGKKGPTKKQLDRAWRSTRAWADKLGVTVEEMLRHVPFPLDDPVVLERMALPPDWPGSFVWAVTIPTRRDLLEAADRMLPAYLNLIGMGPLAQRLLSPVVVLLRAAAVVEYAKLREALIYAEMVVSQPDRKPALKTRTVRRYLHARGIKLFQDGRRRGPRRGQRP